MSAHLLFMVVAIPLLHLRIAAVAAPNLALGAVMNVLLHFISRHNLLTT